MMPVHSSIMSWNQPSLMILSARQVGRQNQFELSAPLFPRVISAEINGLRRGYAAGSMPDYTPGLYRREREERPKDKKKEEK